jgi:predicted kinase
MGNMSELRQKFIHWYFDEFQLTDLYRDMVDTIEDSPWHRERNVGAHTDMVVSQYLSRTEQIDNEFFDKSFDVRGAIGCAFHDVAKPPCEIVKYKPERGEYRAYYGHEQVSARMWEDWAVRNWTFLSEEFLLEPQDIYTIGWMIEHHVPWANKKDEKLNAFANTAYETLALAPTWINMLMADQTGRISDDSHQRLEECGAWIDDHRDRRHKAMHRWKTYSDKTVYMLIGAPGCGKSTYRNKLLADHPDAAIVCMDDLRLEWYGGSYDDAFIASTKDSKFNAKVDKTYIETLRENDVVILDNTNTMTKKRRRWLAPARARDFKVAAVLFPVAKETLKERQSKRDKFVPFKVIDGMYDRMQLPMIGDFDEVIVCDGNLET